ncbi:sugar phosphate nucleotidyltransferase [Caulobacter sp. LjRoot300]|uniref:phosphocholine cytidylyltransferase family protein n=1 Tax=Caulobacter sp. LjRoot300 TaxID=3342321 RepID=UPI003ECF16D8
MAKPAKAIILSAGQGKRLSPLTDTRPKCLVELSGRTVLHWQLKHLAQAGITEAVVVTGFAADTVEKEVAGLDIPGLTVRTLFNPFYALTDNLATCWLARGEMRGDFLLLNGDTLFETGVAERLIAAPPAPITVTIDRKAAGYDADDMKVLTEGLSLRAIGKTIDQYDAESIGFLRFDPEGAALFTRIVEQALRTPEGLKRWYLSVINQIAQDHDVVRVQSIEGLDWAEMDFPEDLPKNRELAAAWVAAGE